MAISQIFFKKKNLIEKIELDVIISESATGTARLTQNPVEHGADVSDHRIMEPMEFSVSGVVSNISSSLADTVLNASTILKKNDTKAREAWNALLELQATGRGFKLVQGLKIYWNIFILSLSETQNVDTANGLFFTATMKEIVFVGAKVISRSQFNGDDIGDSAVPTTQGGLKSA